jgi:2-haloacid dehalogenase
VRPLPEARAQRADEKLIYVINPAFWPALNIKPAVKYAGIREYLDEIISSGDEAKAFKPSPKVYQLGLARAGTPKENILWVTGHFWEVVGAAAQGIKTAWVNRMMLPHDYVGITPTYQTTTMTELADVLAKKL